VRIAYVCADPGVPVFGTKGCSVHAQGVLGALVRAGAQVELFTSRPGGDAPPALARVVVHDLGRPQAADAAVRERRLLDLDADLHRRLLDAGPFDLVYERHALFASAAMRVARSTGVPGVLEVNAPLVEEQAAHRVLINRRGAERHRTAAFAAASVITAVSRSLGATLNLRPEAAGKVVVVPNGVDPARFPAPAPREPGRPFTVAFVGTLKPWHGLDVLVDAFSLLRRQVHDARLLVIGDGPGRAPLELALAGVGAADAAHLPGAVAPADVGRLLAGADAAVAPYPGDDANYFSPLKVFEGMAAGLPVVASRVGQLPELIRDGRTGLLVAPGDPEALAASLVELAHAPARRARIGAAAREHVLREHTWDGVVRRVLGLAVPAGAPA
jgi:glycosyltransferase involved in cell wall biosynthesis